MVDEYAKHGRLVDAGTVEQAEQAAARVWLADTIAGRDALLVVGTNTAAARVSNQLRTELVRLGRVQERGVPLGMPGWEGTVAGVGDLVQARRNAWHLDGWAGNTEAPINRQTYRVTATHANGAMTVARVTGRGEHGAEQLGDPIALPGSYVRDRVTLAYAATVHAAHGRNVDAGYGVLAPGTDAAAAYVQSSRGRETNVLFVVTRNVADTAEIGETQKIARRTAAEVLADVIRPPDVERGRTALTQAEQAADRGRSIPAQVDPMLTVVADTLAGRTERWLDQLAATGALPAHHRVALAADEARTTLDPLLRSVELAGHDPAQALTDAVTSASLDGSTSVAQVLHFRIRTAHKGRLHPQVTGYADLLPRHLEPDTRAALETPRQRTPTRGAPSSAPPWPPPRRSGPAKPSAPPPTAADRPGRAGPVGGAGRVGRLLPRAGRPHRRRGPARRRTPGRAGGEARPVPGRAHRPRPARRRRRRRSHVRRPAPRPGRRVGTRTTRRPPLRRRRTRSHPRRPAHARGPTPPCGPPAPTPTPTRSKPTSSAPPPPRPPNTPNGSPSAVRDLEFADDVRALWRADTAVTRDHAERARVAAGLKGIDLDNPAERVTAQEWLDAHLIAQLAAEADQPVTDTDLAPDDAALHATSDGQQPRPERAAEDRADQDVPAQPDERGEDHNRGDGDGNADGDADEHARSADTADTVDDSPPHRVRAPEDVVAPDIRDTLAPDPTERADPTIAAGSRRPTS